MKVKELIKILKKHPADMTVLVAGYEDGYDNISSITEQKVIKTKREKDWWSGEYQEDAQHNRDRNTVLSEEIALIIPRQSKHEET